MGIPVEDLTTSWEYEIPIEFWIHLIILRLIDLSIVLVRMTKSVKLIQGILNISEQSARTQTPQWNLLLSLLLISHNWLSIELPLFSFTPGSLQVCFAFLRVLGRIRMRRSYFLNRLAKLVKDQLRKFKLPPYQSLNRCCPTSTNFH